MASGKVTPMAFETKGLWIRIITGFVASLSFLIVGWMSVPIVFAVGFEREVFRWSLTGKLGATELLPTILGGIPIWLVALR